MSGPGEFELIREYFASRIQAGEPGSGAARSVELGIGDDCALLNPPAGKMLATSVDTLVADVHFPADADPYKIASRALRVNLSDLAAMNATPLWFTLALTLPENSAEWLEPFARGLADTARQHGITLVGGDTTKGPLSITIQVTGTCERPLRRDGAGAGDHIFVSGPLGAATAALPIVTGKEPVSNEQRQQADAAYYFPEPQFEIAHLIGDYASAALDISDGLLGDLGHICEASDLGAELTTEQVPVAALVETMLRKQGEEDMPTRALETALTGGDDYQLCFTVPEQHLQAVFDTGAAHGLPITAIGRMTAEKGIRLLRSGSPWQPEHTGYRHF
ncbi:MULTISPECIES: thiamine-phosphate kinase [Microbulbifer]|uniref:Thiamine-monophosphate kinase n=1 Tax=Microbulbifer celer TaxID=435905 RepID=A0ABW3UDG5_9GAMM|nr:MULTISPECIES: thiamine-phosphate kinase [Microbulbifer]UFN57567.1 thiamine-phosphate kinase [Microbulbifer celer]